MKNNFKLIIIFSAIILILVIYILFYLANNFKGFNIKNALDNKTKIEENEKNQTENNNTLIKSAKQLGDLVEVKVNNNEKKEFYILYETEYTYTLISKENFGVSTYHTSDNCNVNNEINCDIKANEIVIDKFINEKTQNWSNASIKRLPLTDEINRFLEDSELNNEFLKLDSYWVEKKNNENNQAYYYDKDNDAIVEDKIYNEHSVYIVIEVIKDFVEKK